MLCRVFAKLDKRNHANGDMERLVFRSKSECVVFFVATEHFVGFVFAFDRCGILKLDEMEFDVDFRDPRRVSFQTTVHH